MQLGVLVCPIQFIHAKCEADFVRSCLFGFLKDRHLCRLMAFTWFLGFVVGTVELMIGIEGSG